MPDIKNAPTAKAPQHRGRGCLLTLGLIALAVVAWMVLGPVYESAAEASDARLYPPPGQMVDIGGYRLHINCTGTGAPTVVIDAGWGDWSTMWAWVQRGVAPTTRVCTYDRAGTGWSDPGPLPRDARQFAKELHALLLGAGIPGPYVLVGHSMGGLPVRVFTHEYPSDVAGVVLIESMSPAQFKQPPAGAASTPSHASTILPGLARLGLVRLLARPLGLIPALPADVQNAYVARLVLPSSLQAVTDEGQGMPESAIQARNVTTFGDIPLIVLTSSRNNDPEGWQQMQADLTHLSSNSQQLFADKSGHAIQLDQPDAAVAAIVQMVKLLRK